MIQPELGMIDAKGLNRLLGADGHTGNAISSLVWLFENFWYNFYL
jgi:hypothetical protein